MGSSRISGRSANPLQLVTMLDDILSLIDKVL